MPLAEVKSRLSEVVDEIERESSHTVITKHGRPAAVVISVDEYESMIETAYLLSTPANREWLLESLAQADRGELQTVEFPFTAVSEKSKAKKTSK